MDKRSIRTSTAAECEECAETGDALPPVADARWNGGRILRHVALIAVSLLVAWYELVLIALYMFLGLGVAMKSDARGVEAAWVQPWSALAVSALAGALVLLESSRLWKDTTEVLVGVMRTGAIICVIGTFLSLIALLDVV